MQTNLTPGLLDKQNRETAEQILRRCVHCGFCNTDCPTFRLTANELDAPRGRIYQIKDLLEGATPSKQHLLHLDRCLLCQSCETHCPSGVEFGKLLDIGRSYAATMVKRPLKERAFRWLLIRILCNRKILSSVLLIARFAKPMLPKKLAKQIPKRAESHLPKQQVSTPKPKRRRVVMLEGCVEAATAPDIYKHCAHLLNKLGIETIMLQNACCAALPYHMEDKDYATAMIKSSLDRLLPRLEAGAEALVSTASGCGNFIKSWHQALPEKDWHDKAARAAAACKDISEIIAAEPPDKLLDNLSATHARAAFQCPCSLQHGQKITPAITDLLQRCGIALVPQKNSHLCCGSAGYYSLGQPEIAAKLRAQKLEALLENSPDVILTANIGCQLHLQAESPVPVIHWIKLLN